MMQTTLTASMPGYIILAIIFITPAIWFIRHTIKKRKIGRKPSITPMEMIFLILMPVLGLWFYDILIEGQRNQYDWKYYSAIVIIPIIITSYFISRIAKDKFNRITKILCAMLMIGGIFIAIWMMIHFYSSVGSVGGMIIFSPFMFFIFFAFPYYSLFTVILLLVFELGDLFNVHQSGQTLILQHEE